MKTVLSYKLVTATGREGKHFYKVRHFRRLHRPVGGGAQGGYMKAFTLNLGQQSRGVLAMRAGVSMAALLAAGTSASAWAQAETQAIAPNTTQAAAPAQEVGEPAPAEVAGDIVVTGRRAALQAADQRKRRSETIVDSIVADDAGKLPDNSIT